MEGGCGDTGRPYLLATRTRAAESPSAAEAPLFTPHIKNRISFSVAHASLTWHLPSSLHRQFQAPGIRDAPNGFGRRGPARIEIPLARNWGARGETRNSADGRPVPHADSARPQFESAEYVRIQKYWAFGRRPSQPFKKKVPSEASTLAPSRRSFSGRLNAQASKSDPDSLPKHLLASGAMPDVINQYSAPKRYPGRYKPLTIAQSRIL